MGTSDGSIIATIIAAHIPTKDAAAPAHACPHIGIHAMDSDQPPGIGIAPMYDIDMHPATLAATLAANSGARTARQAPRRRCSITAPPCGAGRLVVLVVTAPPDARLVASPGSTVQPLVRAPEGVQSARKGGVGVVDDTVLEREGTHARPVSRVRGRVGAGRGRDLSHRALAAAFLALAPFPRRLAPVVVFDVPLSLLRLGERDVEVGIE